MSRKNMIVACGFSRELDTGTFHPHFASQLGRIGMHIPVPVDRHFRIHVLEVPQDTAIQAMQQLLREIGNTLDANDIVALEAEIKARTPLPPKRKIPVGSLAVATLVVTPATETNSPMAPVEAPEHVTPPTQAANDDAETKAANLEKIKEVAKARRNRKQNKVSPELIAAAEEVAPGVAEVLKEDMVTSEESATIEQDIEALFPTA
jgi:hypothetical protein